MILGIATNKLLIIVIFLSIAIMFGLLAWLVDYLIKTENQVKTKKVKTVKIKKIKQKKIKKDKKIFGKVKLLTYICNIIKKNTKGNKNI